MEADPSTTLHVPIPTNGSVAAMVKVPLLHCSWSGPAAAFEGGSWLVRMISRKLSAHVPLLIVQRSLAKSPAGMPTTVVAGKDGFVMLTDGAPSSSVHNPVPTLGVLALMRNMPLLHCSISGRRPASAVDRKSTRLNSSHVKISYAVFCLKKKKT